MGARIAGSVEGIQLGPQLGGQFAAELREPVGDLLLPLGGVDVQCGGEVFIGGLKAVGVDGRRVRDLADGGVDGVGGAFQPFDDPFEDTRVFPVFGPQELPAVTAPEPVHLDDFGQQQRLVFGVFPMWSQWAR